MSRSFYAIVNRAAGGGRCAKSAPAALRELERLGVDLEVAFTERPRHATELVERAAAAGRRCFLSAGGDGTAAEVVNGLVAAGVSRDSELAMLPLGTGNSFLRDFEISDLEAAIAAIVRRKTRPVDVLRLSHEEGVIHFINTMGTGFVARAGQLTNDRFKFLGAAGYIAAVFVCVVRLQYEDNKLRYGDAVDDARTVLTSFSNSQFTGGMMRMAPEAQVSDGLLDLVRAGPLGRGALIDAFRRIFAGTHTDLDEVWTRQLERVEFVDPTFQAVLIDGDLHQLKPLAIDVLPAAINLVA
ncbi:MAG: diacylglycerol/lipid kinase family protein [Polyangiales bacterium]